MLAVETPADATAAVASVRTARQQVAGLEIIVCATDRFMAKPIELTTLDELDRVTTHNFIVPFAWPARPPRPSPKFRPRG